jgi:pimeloyl-ACP methyl ester carboxylesterase
MPRSLHSLKLSSGLSLAYRDEGPRSATPLVLIHGITEDHRVWEEFVPELSRDARVIRVDLPGHGASSPLPTYTAQTLVTPLAELVQKLELDRPHVVGHSLGGLMATLLGALVPVRSIINVDQSLRLGPFIEQVRAIAPQLAGPDFVEALTDEMDRLGGPAMTVELRRELQKYRTDVVRPVVLGLWLPLVNESEESVTAMLAPLLGQVTVPYLSLHGEEPDNDYEAWLRNLIPSAHAEVWPGLGHWLHRLKPVRFARRARTFFGSVTRIS